MDKIKNRAESEKKFINATLKLLAQNGIKKLGIRSIARKAELNPMLIYRYFNNLEGLLHAVAESAQFWPDTVSLKNNVLKTAGKNPDYPTLVTSIIKTYIKELEQRPLTQEIMKWELLEPSPLAESLNIKRERVGVELTQELLKLYPSLNNENIICISSILVAGLTYLFLKKDSSNLWKSYNITTKSTWDNFFGTIQTSLGAMFETGCRK